MAGVRPGKPGIGRPVCQSRVSSVQMWGGCAGTLETLSRQLPSIKEVLGDVPLKTPYKEEARKDIPG